MREVFSNSVAPVLALTLLSGCAREEFHRNAHPLIVVSVTHPQVSVTHLHVITLPPPLAGEDDISLIGNENVTIQASERDVLLKSLADARKFSELLSDENLNSGFVYPGLRATDAARYIDETLSGIGQGQVISHKDLIITLQIAQLTIMRAYYEIDPIIRKPSGLSHTDLQTLQIESDTILQVRENLWKLRKAFGNEAVIEGKLFSLPEPSTRPLKPEPEREEEPEALPDYEIA